MIQDNIIGRKEIISYNMNRVKRRNAGDLYIQEPTLYDKNYIVYLVVDADFCLMDLEKFRSHNKEEAEKWLKQYKSKYKEIQKIDKKSN